VGAPAGSSVTLKCIWVYQTPGLMAPGAAASIAHHEGTETVQIGDAVTTDYAFDDPWELMPGRWAVRLWLGDRKLLEQSLPVVKK